MNLIYGAGAKLVRGLTPFDDFSLLVDQTPLAIDGSISAQTIKDVVWTIRGASGVDNNFRLASTSTAEYINVTPAICSVDSAGNVSRLADGLARVQCKVFRKGVREYSQQLVRSGAAAVKESVNSLATGSLIKYLHDQRNAILAASVPNAANQRAYVNADGTGGSNPSNMLLRTDVAGFTPIDLSSIINGNSYRWLTPKHRIFTYHTNPYWGDGSAIVQDGTRYGKKLLGDTGIVYEPNGYTGTVCTLLPSNWRSYLPTWADTMLDIPVWSRRTWVGAKDSGEKFWIQAATKKGDGALLPVDTNAAAFAHPTNGSMGVGGDSGTPVFMGINGKAVLIGHISYSGGLLNADYADYIPTINSVMQELAQAAGDVNYATYSAQTADLSGFTAY
jgi:hypothetical protein